MVTVIDDDRFTPSALTLGMWGWKSRKYYKSEYIELRMRVPGTTFINLDTGTYR